VIDELRRIAMFTSGVAELSRDRAERLVRKAVKGGDVRKGQASNVVKNLIDVSRQNRKELVGLIRSELQSQIGNLGLATKRDLERMERRVARLEERSKAAKKKTTAKKSTAKKTSAKSTRSAEPRSRPSSGS
jgi:polyhydroxyalkanoate synthesis regulator phasin